MRSGPARQRRNPKRILLPGAQMMDNKCRRNLPHPWRPRTHVRQFPPTGRKLTTQHRVRTCLRKPGGLPKKPWHLILLPRLLGLRLQRRQSRLFQALAVLKRTTRLPQADPPGEGRDSQSNAGAGASDSPPCGSVSGVWALSNPPLSRPLISDENVR